MTDLVVQSIDTLSLMDFQPIPYDLLRSRCVEMTSGLTAYTWRDWPEGLQALIHPDDLMRFDEVDLRAMLAQQDDEVRQAMADNLIVANAFTYRDFTDREMEIYRDALAMPQMMEVYELMNAIHFTIMADRFERMALEMVNLTPTQEL